MLRILAIGSMALLLAPATWAQPSGRTERSITHFFIVAPVAWYASEQGTDNVVVSCEFDAPPAGEEIVVRFTGDASVLAIAGGESEAFVNATPRDIKVKFRR